MTIFKQSAIVLTQNWVLVPLNFATGVLVARVLGPEGNGILLLLTGLSAVLISLFSFGLPAAAGYYSKQGRYNLGEILAVCLFVAFLSTLFAGLLFLFFARDLITLFLGNTADIAVQPFWIWMTLAGVFPSLISLVGDVLLIVNGEMKAYVIKNTGSVVLQIVLTWLLVLILSWGVTGALWAQLISLGAQIGIFGYWCSKKKARTGSSLSLTSIMDMLRVGLQQYGISLIALVSKRFDTFLIAGMLGVREAGYFSIPYMIYSQMKSIPQSTMWPLVSALANKESGGQQLALATRMQTALMLMIAVIMGISAPWWIRIVFGEAFLPATGALWMILPTFVVTPIVISGNAYLTSLGIPGKVIPITIISTIAQVLVSLILVPRIGILGSAVGLVVNYIVIAAWMVRWLVRYANFRVPDLLLVSVADLRHMFHYGMGMLNRCPFLSASGGSKRN